MKSTRERILHNLLGHPRATINDLAAAVDINTISVRHHLSSLQAEGLVTAEEERHGVGRPRLVYYLTEKGRERFPTNYLRLTARLLSELKQTVPQSTVNLLFAKMAEGLADHYTDQVSDLSMEQRLDLVKNLLEQEGFTVEWEKLGDQYHIHEITCPYYHIGQSHPEVCTLDQTVISRVLSIPAEKVNCILRGDAHCTYVVSGMLPMEKTV